ncbi:MAG TPA: DNA translocase FtsK, partial [Candidatus Andersenbacteria bacterium]|nr:DNA translocase FtsK [Candidatus Andersenbacteria bacterium]
DMLYLAGDKARPVRLQGGFVSEEEVRQVVAAVRETGETDYDETVMSAATGGVASQGEMGDDPLLEEARQVVVRSDKASASLLQRRLRVGYARAARLLDMLEERGVVGTAEGNKPRPVLRREAQEESAQPLPTEGEAETARDDFANRDETW